MRHHSRERYDHRDSRRRSPERQERSRERHLPPERSREVNQRPHWNRNPRQNNHPSSKLHAENVLKVNRKQTCPFLVRIFYAINKQNTFNGIPPLPQTQIFLHLWMDCSLREIAELLRAHLASIRTKQRFQFWRVYTQEGKSQPVKEELGTVYMHRKFDRSEQHYLQKTKFKIGDYIDISINYK